jgi:hypothetical protein
MPEGDLLVLPAACCDYCGTWFPLIAGEDARRYCSPAHRRAGTARARLGLTRNLEPGASADRLRLLAEHVREAQAGQRSWSDVGQQLG